MWSDLWTIENESAQKVDWLNDRIQPFVLFKMPDGNWAEFPLGIFIPSTPTRVDSYGQVVREVEAYDGLVILDQDKFTDRTAFPKGASYKSTVESILRGAGITKIKMDFPSKNLPTDKEFGVGDSKLQAINSLLTELNMDSLWVDAYGYFVSDPYKSPAEKSPEFEYIDNELSILVEGMEEELDLFEIPNSFVVTVSNPESAPMVARVENNDPDSIVSIPSRGRKIVDFREVEQMADQSTLNNYTQRIAFEASQVYGRIRFKTPIMPIHEFYDVLRLRYAPLGIDGNFAEMNWTLRLEAGAQMEHEVRKVVAV